MRVCAAFDWKGGVKEGWFTFDKTFVEQDRLNSDKEFGKLFPYYFSKQKNDTEMLVRMLNSHPVTSRCTKDVCCAVKDYW